MTHDDAVTNAAPTNAATTNAARATSWQADEVVDLVQVVHASAVTSVEWVGSGHWSDCFAFEAAGAELVIRIGHLVEDFHKDQFAAQLDTDSLPVPQIVSVGEIGPSRGTKQAGYYAISQRARGTPLEQVQDWDLVIPSLVELFTSLRNVPVHDFAGWGRWDRTGQAESSSWRGFLLAVDQDPPSSRVHGWRRKLASSPDLEATFAAGYGHLCELVADDVPRSLVHNDLFNRNVHMIGADVSGVFDWGNSLIGDHLYDLAILCFWEPWWPHVEVQPVLDALHVRWREPGQQVENLAIRLQTCLLHIGLEHIAYHCFLNDMAEAELVASRMEAIVQVDW